MDEFLGKLKLDEMLWKFGETAAEYAGKLAVIYAYQHDSFAPAIVGTTVNLPNGRCCTGIALASGGNCTRWLEVLSDTAPVGSWHFKGYRAMSSPSWWDDFVSGASEIYVTDRSPNLIPLRTWRVPLDFYGAAREHVDWKAIVPYIDAHTVSMEDALRSGYQVLSSMEDTSFRCPIYHVTVRPCRTNVLTVDEESFVGIQPDFGLALTQAFKKAEAAKEKTS